MHRCVVFCLSKRNDACNIVSVSWVITLHVHTRPPARARSHIKLCTLFTVFMVLADVYIRELQCSNIGRDDDDNGLDFSLKCCCFLVVFIRLPSYFSIWFIFLFAIDVRLPFFDATRHDAVGLSEAAIGGVFTSYARRWHRRYVYKYTRCFSILHMKLSSYILV